METQNHPIDATEIALQALFTRFIRYTETNIIAAKDAASKDISLDEFKKAEAEKTEATEMERYLDAVAINACEGILDITVTKVRIVTGVDIADAESDVEFEQTFTCFKNAITHAENVYKNEGSNLYEFPLFTIIDVVTSIAAQYVVEQYFSAQPEPETAEEAAATEEA